MLIKDETGAQRNIGFVLDVGRADGQGRCYLQVGDQHLNRAGVLHGGIITTLLDSGMGAAGSLHIDRATLPPLFTISLTVNFLAPGRPGLVEALARVTGGGRRTMFIAGELHHQDGTLIATATGVFRPAAAPKP
ncbi:PaaI family thioesterase [Paracoccus sp. (in: a-proteobacteria)]|uniref:PaaI family thioesterase n=1 Tax=Paracoccus sp. TaxID=267 RepID=UPI0026DF4AD9|nr:PaaI family thioesterase [Paracoccus sp. (in: a-proteobacteria)]MDO5648321.1 PaaI family thioesterase [Paracoccus sp. (in: a-proteobacteria)]